MPLLDPPNSFGEGKRIVFCTLPDDRYLNNFCYYNKKIFINIGKNRKIPDELVSDSNNFVIWFVLKDSIYYVVGWSNDCEFYSSTQEIKHSKFGGLDITYQIKSKSENCFMVLPVNSFCNIPEDYFPSSFKKDGFILENDIKDFLVSDVLENINTYSGEVEVIGLTDDAIYSTYPLIEDNVDKIIKESIKYPNSYRSIWLANLAVKKEENFKTVFNQGIALKNMDVLDEAFIVFKKALELNPKSEEALINLIKLCVMLDKYNDAKEYFNNLILNKDKELHSCLEYIF